MPTNTPKNRHYGAIAGSPYERYARTGKAGFPVTCCSDIPVGNTRICFERLLSDRLLVNWRHKMMDSTLDDLVNNRLQPRNFMGSPENRLFYQKNCQFLINVLIRILMNLFTI
ncbi:hypothetical protein ACKEWL_13425 [Yersinia enterocolitica]